MENGCEGRRDEERERERKLKRGREGREDAGVKKGGGAKKHS